MWGFGWNDPSSLKVLVNKRLACLLLFQVKRVYLSDFRNERGFKVYGVVIGSVGRKNIVGLLGEYIFKIRAPIGNFLFRGL